MFNGLWDGGASRPGLDVVSRRTVFLWLGFVVALTIPCVTFQGNSVTIKGFLVAMVLSISWHLLRGSWVESMRLDHRG